jgi:segregation and condensation protein B
MADDLKGKVQAMLFVSDKPVEPEKIAQVTDSDISVIRSILKDLVDAQVETNGFLLIKVGRGYRYYVNPRYSDVVKTMLSQELRSQISLAAFEVLAIIAYLQPVTRSRINDIRGVDSDSSIRSLLDKNLIRARGRAIMPGSPILYATT